MATTSETVRARIADVLRSLAPEDLEERVSPVKCNKHPDHPECGEDYGVVLYNAPVYGSPEPDYGVPSED